MSNAIEKRETQEIEKVAQRPWVKPRVDIYENQDELLVIADLPGVAEKDLHIHLDKDQLDLEARCGEEPASPVLSREFRPTDYQRSFVVPRGIDASKISAELRDGVLRLHLPKADSIKPRRITVTSG